MSTDGGPFAILQSLRDAAEARAKTITAQYADWPYRRGCDTRCRSLAQPPALSEVEWQEVEAGLALLPVETRGEVSRRMASANGSAVPYTCASLDLIYKHRPIACRTYGFYVDERGVGHTANPSINQRVEDCEFTNVVWGNHSAVERRLAALGEPGPQECKTRMATAMPKNRRVHPGPSPVNLTNRKRSALAAASVYRCKRAFQIPPSEDG